jgi:hypothetical protein
MLIPVTNNIPGIFSSLSLSLNIRVNGISNQSMISTNGGYTVIRRNLLVMKSTAGEWLIVIHMTVV